jgi:hypothetical protein
MTAAVLALGGVSPALASSTQEAILQDDNELLYSTPEHVGHALDQLVSLGVQRVRVSLIWGLVAPRPKSMRRPRFDATDPAAYPAGAWERYDTLVVAAVQRGIGVEFNVTAPAPYWAATSPAPAPDVRSIYSPSASEFGKFVEAVGRRYSGDYVANPPPAPPPPPTILGIPLPFGNNPPAPTAPVTLPRVNYWGIYNEPDEGGWLTPQWRRLANGRWVEAAPVIYRGLVDAAWRALLATTHGTDTILIGETAARGLNGVYGLGASMKPMPFIRALYCVNGGLRPLSGRRASDLSCPTGGSPAAFAAAHPGLFQASGYAHHPYSFGSPPAERMSDPDVVTLADLPRLEHALDQIFQSYGAQRIAGLPIYIDEWGYKSNPPNPYVQWTQVQQAAFINQGEYMAWVDPRVRSTAQFLLVDSPPNAQKPVGSRSYWGTFQTGLIMLNGHIKPSLAAYRLPVFVPDPRPGPRVTVWGAIRPGLWGTIRNAVVDFELTRRGAAGFAAVRNVVTANPLGYFVAHVAVPGPGSLRITWRSPDGTTFHSRTVRVG